MSSYKKVRSEKEIVSELAKNMESEGFKIVELPLHRRVAMPDLTVKYNKFIYLIEVKAGSPNVYLTHSFFSGIEKKMREASYYFLEQGYIARAALLTNQKISLIWEGLLIQVDMIDGFNISEIIQTLREDIKKYGILFEEGYERLFHEKETEIKLKNLQQIAQISQLLDKNKLGKIISYLAENPSPAIRGELCYLLGRWGKPDVIPALLDFLKDQEEYVRSEAAKALLRLREIIDKQVQKELLLEEKAYLEMQEELLDKYTGQFAGFYKGKLIAVRPDKHELMRAVEKEIGQVRYYIRNISKEVPRVRLPKPRKAWKM